MVWKIDFGEAARKQMKKLPRHVQSHILDYLQHQIAPLTNPRLRGEGLKANLAGLWRYRVGDYRIICQIKQQELVVLVVKIGHRKEVYE